MHTRSEATAQRRTGLLRLAAVVALSSCTLLAAAPLAAADAPGDSLPNRQAAVDTLNSGDTRAEICTFYDEPDPEAAPGTVTTVPDEADPCKGVPDFTISGPVALNEVAHDFATGAVEPAPSNVTTLGYAIAAVQFTDGRSATVMLSPTNASDYEFAAVREGDTDYTYASQADAGTTVFNEPEIEAYYKLTGDTVEPLNDSAQKGLDGRSSASLPDYQQILVDRYGDEQSGSQYDKDGEAGGFKHAVSKPPSSPLTPLVVGGTGTSMAAAGGAFFLLRRKRASTR
ncbi:hypothetical protein [Kitasatospora viridis]|uniref:LPXTG-motif cell wall-anchored protein n=1 Tax=Kitasatospora viridis TaxID=281105 RepID=A0A561TSN9_9ACTN|nr:hypothetical protein [Kitasatospora viridis]TWF90129.1 hypothetical protein FHX73_13173 [Kitasatospora viridis]